MTGEAIRMPVAAPRSGSFDVFAGWFAVAVLIRIFVPGEVLDSFEHYSSLGGSFIEKIHPGAYLIAAIFVIYLFSRRPAPTVRERALKRASYYFVFAALTTILIAAALGQAQGDSYVLDSLLLGPLVGILTVTLPRESRAFVLEIVIYCLVANALLTLFEFSTHTRLIPYPFEEYFFRPAGLLGHPLTNGMANAIAIPLVWILPYSMGRRAALALLFLAADFASGARIASIVGTIGAVISAWMYLWYSLRERRIDESLFAVSTVVVAGFFAIVLALIVGAGLAERFLQSDLVDVSAQSRFTIFRILTYIDTNQLLYGISNDRGYYLIQSLLGLETIENPFLAYVLQFGLIGAAILVPGLLYFLWRLARDNGPYASLAVGMFLVIASTSVSIAGKEPLLALVAAVSLGAGALDQSRARAPAGSKSGTIGRRQARMRAAENRPQLSK
jgi:hypothetical protein